MKVLVCGGREYNDKEKVNNSLKKLRDKHGIDLIIEGGAKGADKLGGEWADSNGIPHCTFHANWEALGKRAGPIRNENMIKFGSPDCVVAFAGGIGTNGMIRLAESAGIPVWRIK
jgi:hypothetical protein